MSSAVFPSNLKRNHHHIPPARRSTTPDRGKYERLLINPDNNIYKCQFGRLHRKPPHRMHRVCRHASVKKCPFQFCECHFGRLHRSHHINLPLQDGLHDPGARRSVGEGDAGIKGTLEGMECFLGELSGTRKLKSKIHSPFAWS